MHICDVYLLEMLSNYIKHYYTQYINAIFIIFFDNCKYLLVILSRTHRRRFRVRVAGMRYENVIPVLEQKSEDNGL